MRLAIRTFSIDCRKPLFLVTFLLVLVSLSAFVAAGRLEATPPEPCGIFVAPTGTDHSACGLDPNDPCHTVQYAVTRAVTEGLSCVFLQAGNYAGPVDLADGIILVGGYDASWNAGPWSDPQHRATIAGGYHAATSQFVAIFADALPQGASLSNLYIQGPAASGDVGGYGKSSYAVFCRNTNGLVVEDSHIEGGNGADGGSGANGTNALSSPTSSMRGGNGGNATEYQTLCDDVSRGAGGAPGTNPNAPSATSGGGGGAGGTMDTNCSFPFDYSAAPGLNGANAALYSTTYGRGGNGGAPCGGGSPGQPGRTLDGAGGSGGSAGGWLSGDFWYGEAGTSGVLGEHGSGGGGGGGAGGCDTGTDEYGAGGAGGGAGGARAPSAGGGGRGGGGSFALYAVNSTATVTNCDIVGGQGGAGGGGGIGGNGQPGGSGGNGGSGIDGGNGGNGGNGGRGGHSGGGGGGAGGDGWCVYKVSSTVTIATSNLMPGTGGSGGLGGSGFIPGGAGVQGAAGTVGISSAPPLAKIAGAAAKTSIVPCDPAPCLASTDVATTEGTTTVFAFRGAFPNPATSATRFAFALPRSERVRIDLFDVRGRLVAKIVDETFSAGVHEVPWDGSAAGARPSPGIYWARLRAGDETATRRVTLLR